MFLSNSIRILFIVLNLCCCLETSAQTLDTFSNKLSEKEIYDFITILINETNLNKNNSIDIKRYNYCNSYLNDSICKSSLLNDLRVFNSRGKDEIELFFDSLEGKYQARVKSHDEHSKETEELISFSDVEFMISQNKLVENFVWDNSILKFNEIRTETWYEITLPMFTFNKNVAIVKVSKMCKGLCGSYKTYVCVKKDNIWSFGVLSYGYH